MGVYEENEVPECNVMMGKEKPDNPAFLLKNLPTSFKKNKAERRLILLCVLIVGLVFVTIGLSAVLITSRTHSTTCDKNIQDSARFAITIAPEVPVIVNLECTPCEDDWIYHRGKCYYFSTERDTWRNSEKFCHSHEASLAIIDNKEELDFLFRHKDTDNHWIGVRRTDDNTGWIWSNGTLYNESLFKIIRSSQENMEFAFLNSNDVRSQRGIYDFKWICTKNNVVQ